jgi:hypothetical protein
MTQLPELFGAMVSNVLILVGLTYLLSRLVDWHSPVRTAYSGAVFGLALGVVAGSLLLTSIRIEAAYIDLRSVAVLISAFIGGPVSAIVTTGLALFFRSQLSGPVLLPAVGMIAAALLGIGARALGVRCTLRALIALGAGLAVLRSLMPMVSYLIGNRDLASALDASAGLLPVTILFFPIGVVAMGGLLKFEGKRADQTAGLKSENAILTERDARFQTLFDLRESQ